MLGGKLIILCAALVLQIEGNNIPSFVNLCKRNHPQLNECYLDSFNEVLKNLGDGIPSMNLRNFEPILIEKIQFDQVGSLVNIGAVLTNTRMFGLTKGKAISAEISLDKPTFKIEMDIPNVYMEADYAASGKIMSFQFDSKGVFNSSMTGVKTTTIWSAERETKNGQTWLKNLEVAEYNMEFKTMQIYCSNLFPDATLNEATNRIINENIDLIYKDMLPIITSTVKSVLIDVGNSVFKTFPLDVLFPE